MKTIETVYSPSEDSDLLLSTILHEFKRSNFKKNSFLEIGCGTGYICLNYQFFKKNKAKVTCVDLNKKAVENTKMNAKENNLDVEIILSNLFENVTNTYDFIIFNSPYLNNKTNDIATEDIEVNNAIERYINEVQKYLKNKGKAYILISTENQKFEKYNQLLLNNHWKKISEKNLFFEKLLVYILNNNI